jgi:MFS family permease
MMMKEYDLNSLKYWKESAVLSGTMAFLYLLACIALLVLQEALSYFSIENYFITSLLTASETSSAFLFILFIISGILAARGRKSGVIIGLILSIIIVLTLIIQATSSGLLFLFYFILFPHAVLPIVNIYYSSRAIRSEIQGTIMSLYRFFACSIQYTIAIIVGMLGIALLASILVPFILPMFYPVTFPSTSPSTIGPLISISLILIILFATLYYSAHYMFKNDENDISKKRVYILTSIALLILLCLFNSLPSFLETTEEVGKLLIRMMSIFTEALIIPFIIASLGFVAAIPKQEYEPKPLTISHERIVEKYAIPRQEESYSTSPVIKTKTYERGGIYYCRYCGRIVPADSIYCQYCGRKLR